MQQNEDVIAVYSRKSRFTGKGESIGNQVDLCRSYIRSTFGEQYADRAVVFEDEGFSGGNLNRPGFRKMMDDARAHQFRAVVVYRLDRISRNISDFSHLIEELGRLGVDFISIRESFDTSSPMGRAMMYIASVFSQLERETIAERIRDNLHELAKTGRWLGGTTPTGYASESVRNITVEGKCKKACKLKLVPEEAEIIRKIYHLYSRTESLSETEAQLLREGIKTKTGRDFTRFSIKAILQNPVYLMADADARQYFLDRDAEVFSPPEAFDGQRGILAYNRTHQAKGRATVYLPVSQWIVTVGQHPGLIPSGVWIRTQESLERSKCKSYRKPRNSRALLTGLLLCRCGSRMYPKNTSRITDDGRPIYTYVCKAKERSKGSLCSCSNVSGNALDAAVLEQIRALPEDTGALVSRLSAHRQFYAGQQDTDLPAQLRRQQSEIQRRIRALIDSLPELEDSAAALHVKERVEELHAQAATLRSRLSALETPPGPQALWGARQDTLARRLAGLQSALDALPPEQLRSVIRAVVEKVVWDDRQAHVVLWDAAYEASPAEHPTLPEQTHLREDSK